MDKADIELIRLIAVKDDVPHDCSPNGSVKMVLESDLYGATIAKFTAQVTIEPGTTLLLPSPGVKTDDLVVRESGHINEIHRDSILNGTHEGIKLDVDLAFWMLGVFHPSPPPSDVHPAIRAVEYSIGVRLSQAWVRPKYYLFPNIICIQNFCNPNCHVPELQELATYGICKLTVLKQINVGDEITVDNYRGAWVTDEDRQETIRFFEYTCTTEHCLQCGGSEQQR